MTELDLTYSVGMHVFLPAKILYHGSLTTPTVVQTLAVLLWAAAA